MNYTELGKTGLNVSSIGFGCAPLGDEYGALSDGEATAVVHHAIDSGINFFDTSPYYGRTRSEIRLGEALKGKRDQIVLATKGGRFDSELESGFDFSYQSIIQMCEDSLQRLQTDWIDVYQLHDIEFGLPEAVAEGVRALGDLKKQGKVRFIGVTGFPVTLLKQMAEINELDVTLSYCHGNLLNDRLQDVLVPIVKQNRMGLINASITHMGILTPQGEQSWHPASDTIKQAGRQAADFCAKRGVSLAELAIQFALRQPNVDVTLLGTKTLNELRQTLALIGKPIDEAVLTAVKAILKPVHNQSWPSGLQMYWEASNR